LPTAKAVVAYAGLNPARRESGTWAGRSVISRIGSPALRRALFMPAMAAVRCNPMVMALKKRLSDAGRLRPKQILVAAMRKLLVLCWGILRSGRPFDPSYGQETRNYPAPA
jgi:transposase